MHEYYYENMHGNPEAFTSSIKESLDAMSGHPKTLFFAQATNIIGDMDSFESIIMEDTIWSLIGWDVQQDSEYLINYKLHALDQGGLKYRMWQKWTYQALETHRVKDAISLVYDNVMFPFSFLVWGIPAAAVCL